MKQLMMGLALLASSFATMGADMSSGADNFYKSEQVTQQKVTFNNQYQMKTVGNLFVPKDMISGRQYPAIIVGHPMGAVKEQSSNLYAQKLAEQGFITLAIDCLSGARAKAGHAMPCHLTCTLKTSAPRSITLAASASSIATASVCWVSVAVAALPSAPPKSTRA
jgi:dienelactone hydrolase